MIEYVLMLSLILVPPVMCVCAEKRNWVDQSKLARYQQIYLWVITSGLILLMFLKHDYVGTDTQSYRYFFESAADTGVLLNRENGMEAGYNLLAYLFLKLGLPFRFLLLLNAILYVNAVRLLIQKYSAMPWFSFFMFFTVKFFIFHTTMRQCLALSLTIYAFILLQERKSKYDIAKSVVLWLLAISMHLSAAIFCVVYILIKVKFSKRTMIAAAALFVVATVFAEELINFGLWLIGRSYTYDFDPGYLTFVVYFAVIVMGVLFYKSYFVSDKPCNQMLFNMILFNVVFFFAARYNPYFMRLLYYFQIYNIIYVPNLAKSMQNKFLKYSMLVCFIIYGLLTFTYFGNAGGIRLWPYVYFWEEYPAALLPDMVYEAGGF